MPRSPTTDLYLSAFWEFSRTLREAVRSGDAAKAVEMRDELDLLSCHADLTIRRRCLSVLAESEPSAVSA